MHDDPDPAAGPQPLEQLHHSPATARVPEAVGHGVFATGLIILNNPHEVVLDFVQGISNPRRVSARIVLAHAVAAQFLAALEGSMGRYVASFGPPRSASPPAASPQSAAAPQSVKVVMPPSGSPPPQSPAETPPGEAPSPEPQPATPAPTSAQQPIADIYEQIRLSDDMVGGAYANVVAISHTPAEFCFDFIASVYPRSAVTARVYLAAPRAAEALASLRRSLTPRQPPG